MKISQEWLERSGCPSTDSLVESGKRFPDGGRYRVEVPSTEGPEAFGAVLEEADRLDCPVHRVSQGSGIQMLGDEEIREMARIGADRQIEVCLFVTPRANFDVGGLWNAPFGKTIQWQVRGAEQLRFCLDEIHRAVDLGIRSVLLADWGLIRTVAELRKQDRLPKKLVIKSSAVMAPANPASARLLQETGANTVNVATDLSVAQLSSIRQAVEVPLDVYVEAPDGLGGFVRHHETPGMIRYAAPVYVKLGLRNAPDVYPAGEHIRPTVLALSRERVRRTRLVLDLVRREYPEAAISEPGGEDLGIPVH
jgi:hypothetical protein